MKNKGLKITMVILFIIIIICLIILAYFLFVDIKTKTPENIENKRKKQHQVNCGKCEKHNHKW